MNTGINRDGQPPSLFLYQKTNRIRTNSIGEYPVLFDYGKKEGEPDGINRKTKIICK